jgi:hypothetical protein
MGGRRGAGQAFGEAGTSGVRRLETSRWTPLAQSQALGLSEHEPNGGKFNVSRCGLKNHTRMWRRCFA